MSTASAVLRPIQRGGAGSHPCGTYVYCFGGIETLSPFSIREGSLGTYVYCFGGIETFI